MLKAAVDGFYGGVAGHLAHFCKVEKLKGRSVLVSLHQQQLLVEKLKGRSVLVSLHQQLLVEKLKSKGSALVLLGIHLLVTFITLICLKRKRSI
ncbi:hypothetical protein HanLR1_Chr00c0116g0712151 [Helianthus annuus]|nr:hypothetical protein HanLR1_Chr00c0116g0712151 [Helianthus annuus]